MTRFNRRRFLRAASGLLVPAWFGITRADIVVSATRIAIPAAATYLVSEDCEGASTPTGWTDANSPSWGYTTAPAPLVGTKSLKVSGVATTYKTYAGTSDIWAYMAFNLSDLSSSPYTFEIRNSVPALIAYLRVLSDGAVRAGSGTGTNDSAAGVVSINTTYYGWLHYTKGTGANGVCQVYVSTTETKPGSPTAATTAGSQTTDAAQIFFAAASGNLIVDKIRVSASSIGSNPT